MRQMCMCWYAMGSKTYCQANKARQEATGSKCCQLSVRKQYTRKYLKMHRLLEKDTAKLITLVSAGEQEWVTGGRGERRTYFLFYPFSYFVTFAVSNIFFKMLKTYNSILVYYSFMLPSFSSWNLLLPSLNWLLLERVLKQSKPNLASFFF